MWIVENKTLKVVISIVLFLLIRTVIIFTYGLNVVPVGGDHEVYHLTAVKLSTDHEEWTRAGSEFGYRPPLYFIFLSTVYSIVPTQKYQTGQMLSALLGTINCFLLFLLIRNLFDEKTAWVSFWIRGLLPLFILSDTFVLSEPLFDTFLLTALLILSFNTSSIKSFQWAGIAVCTALCVLTREAGLIYPIIFLFIILLNSNGILKESANIVLFCACIIVILGPWLFRNKYVWGAAFPLSYTSGVNLHIGNNNITQGKWVLVQSPDIPKNITFGTPEFNNWHMVKGIEYIKEDYSRFIKLGFKKIAWFLFPSFHRSDLCTVYGLSNKTASIIGMIIGVSSAALLLFGIIGFVFDKKESYWKITFLLILYSLLVSFIVFGNPRFRDQIDNLLVIYFAQIILRWKEIWIDIKDLTNKWNIVKISIVFWIITFMAMNWVWVLKNK